MCFPSKVLGVISCIGPSSRCKFSPPHAHIYTQSSTHARSALRTESFDGIAIDLSHSLVRSFVRSVYLFEDDSDVLYSGRKRLPPRGRSACLPLFSTGFWPRLYLVDISSVSRRSRSKLIIAPVRAARSEGISRSRAPIPI